LVMAQTNCRIPDELNAAFENAADERGLFRSEVHRRALRHYASANPDEFAAFERYNRVNGGNESAESKKSGAGDPDRPTPAGEATEAVGRGGGDSGDEIVYDPTGEF
jgi:predicted DNA-binding protein